jgi:hypothetical protein
MSSMLGLHRKKQNRKKREKDENNAQMKIEIGTIARYTKGKLESERKKEHFFNRCKETEISNKKKEERN